MIALSPAFADIFLQSAGNTREDALVICPVNGKLSKLYRLSLFRKYTYKLGTGAKSSI